MRKRRYNAAILVSISNTRITITSFGGQTNKNTDTFRKGYNSVSVLVCPVHRSYWERNTTSAFIY